MQGEGAEDPGAGDDGGAVVSSIDRAGAYDRFVIADVSCDERWLGIRRSEAPSLRAWR